ncbi:hypothetical protein ACF0H5_013976 [Mactra antiquata]
MRYFYKRTKLVIIGCLIIFVLVYILERIPTSDFNISRQLSTTFPRLLQKNNIQNLVSTNIDRQHTIQHSSSNKPTDSTSSKGTLLTSPVPSPSKSHKFRDKEEKRQCKPKVDPSNINTTFKFYIYDLPSKFNTDIQRFLTDEPRHSSCYNLDYCGMGEELFQIDNHGNQANITNHSVLSVRNTQQFALETLIHYKLLHSPYRTLDPKQADMFYIPAYTGLYCLTFKKDSPTFAKSLFEYLETHEAENFNSGKPHFSTLSKIQREQGSDMCPTLKHPATNRVIYFGIEKESNPNWEKTRNIYGTKIIVAPYPAYIHFENSNTDMTLHETYRGLKNLSMSEFHLSVPNLSERNVTLFLAAGTRRSNTFRAQLLDQFSVQTSLHPDQFYMTNTSSNVDQIMLITRECSQDHRMTTIPWMLNSIFCLQPPGDSPTRKSTYDSILSGCIPVFFSERDPVRYPFQKYLNYDTFSYTIDTKLLHDKNVYTILKEIPERKVKELHANLLKVAKWFQYSVPDGDIQWSDDAMTLLLHELTSIYNIKTIPLLNA